MCWDCWTRAPQPEQVVVVIEEMLAQVVTHVVAAAEKPSRHQPLAEVRVEAMFVPFFDGVEALGSVPERCLQFLSIFVEKNYCQALQTLPGSNAR